VSTDYGYISSFGPDEDHFESTLDEREDASEAEITTDDYTYVIQIPEIHLVLADSVAKTMDENHQKYQRWPVNEEELQEDLCTFYTRIPVLVHNSKREKDKKELWLCTRSYCLKLSSSRNGNAYIVFGMSRPTLREHDELARGAVKLEVNDWHVHLDYYYMNQAYPNVPYNSNGMIKILEAWELLEEYKKRQRTERQEMEVQPLAEEHEQYLQLVEKLVTISQECEREREPEPLNFFYDQTESTDLTRETRNDVYKFHLSTGTGQLTKDMFVRLKDNTRIRGKVVRIEDEWFTVRFGREIDIEEVSPPGPFETVTVQAAFRVQKKALESLRTGDINNPYLLNVLVDNSYQEHEVASDQHVDGLNKQQLESFQNALHVKDMLLIQGPPGTGKTHTITQIVQHYQNKKQRILITARTHKAVDNVLKELIGIGLKVLRVGHEDKISFFSKDLLIESQAASMQKDILDNTSTSLEILTRLNIEEADKLAKSIQDIPVFIGRLRKLENISNQIIDQHLDDEETIKQRYVDLLEPLKQQQRLLLAQRSKLNEELAALQRRYDDMNEIQLTAVGLKNKKKLELQMGEKQGEIEQLTIKYQQVKDRLKDLQQESEQALGRLRRGAQEAQDTASIRANGVREIYSEIRLILDAARVLNRPPIKRAGLTPGILIQYLMDFQQMWEKEGKNNVKNRYKVLKRWHEQVEASADELHPLLVRRADVIGATCIGSATAHILTDVDFDMVVVDEAGQINVLDLLVPLVRGKRTILVGDHQQLPPLVDDDVQKRILDRVTTLPEQTNTDTPTGENADGESETIDVQLQRQMSDMLTKSVFEYLFDSARQASGHMITLREQHRMPKVLADFVSEQFYQGELITPDTEKKVYRGRGNEFFSKQLVFIDTASLPPTDKQEYVNGHIVEQNEQIQGASYTNPKEAEIIIRLIDYYIEQDQQWVVIVPYRAQAEYIRNALREHLQGEYNPEYNEFISTVDAFQGGEKPIVIYGFTRSNPQCRVGFLSERRRLNVALTRAKQQLILIGDTDTLASARNSAFRKLIRALLQHIKTNRQSIYLRYEMFERQLPKKEPLYESKESL
jgi:replicative DNA helicase